MSTVIGRFGWADTGCGSQIRGRSTGWQRIRNGVVAYALNGDERAEAEMPVMSFDSQQHELLTGERGVEAGSNMLSSVRSERRHTNGNANQRSDGS